MSGSMTSSFDAATGTVVGSGSDAITLLMSGDSYGTPGAPGADAQFTLNVDGQQIGGVQDVSAAHSAGQQQAFTFLGNFDPGAHEITVTFLNNSGTQGDQTDFGRGGDRNLYIDGVSYNGEVVSDSTTPIYESLIVPPEGNSPGNASFTANDSTTIPADAPFTASTTPSAVDVGSGSDTLTLYMAEDPFQGDAQFTVAVDGQQVGGTLTTTAVAWQGQEQLFNLHGDWGSGAHTVTVTFLNDSVGAFHDTGFAIDNVDRNLYIKGIEYDGIAAGGTPWELSSSGSTDFFVAAGGQPGEFVSAETSVAAGTMSSLAASTGDTATITSDTLNQTVDAATGTADMSFLQPAATDSVVASDSTTVMDATGSVASAPVDATQTSVSDWTAPTPSDTGGWDSSWSQNGGHWWDSQGGMDASYAGAWSCQG
jgi:hypothetical protein